MGNRTSWPTTHVSLLERIRRPDDRAAWEEFAAIYGPLIYRYCSKRGLPDSDAADVTQEVFRQVSRAIDDFRYDPRRGRFRSWLGTVTRHEILRYLKQRDRPGQGAGGADAAQHLENMSGGASCRWLDEFTVHLCKTALARIRPEFDAETWRAFEMLWHADESPAKVAERLDRPRNWVYKAKFRVQQRFKEELEILAADSMIFAGE